MTIPRWMFLISLIVLAGTSMLWWPKASAWVDTKRAAFSIDPESDPHDHGVDHGHDHPAADESQTLELSPQARRNLGLTDEQLRPIELTDYSHAITVPAVIIEKPGRSSIVVSSPLNGVVTHVHAVTGEAVEPGELLFEVRLTYEDLVETQTAYLKTISELEVENREIARLEEATRSGAVSGKQLLDRRYAKEKLEAFAKSQREALKLHGLSDRQVDAITTDGKLLRDLQIVAPEVDRHDEDEELRLSRIPIHPVTYKRPQSFKQPVMKTIDPTTTDHPLVIDELLVHKGQAVLAGEKLCSLSDYSQMYIEGKSFENDIVAISEAARKGWTVEAIVSGSSVRSIVRDLQIVYVSNSIDLNSRTLSFFVELPNEMMQDQLNQDSQRFISWKYRVGQRLELRVPVEKWDDQIVLPVSAVVKDGAEWFVFQQNGKTFSRVPVHVLHRDPISVVVANDGSIYPGDVIARTAAHQMQMALKNKSGGAVDPHAGHTH